MANVGNKDKWTNIKSKTIKVRTKTNDDGAINYYTTLSSKDKDGNTLFENVKIVRCKNVSLEEGENKVNGFIGLDYQGHVCIFVQDVLN